MFSRDVLRIDPGPGGRAHWPTILRLVLGDLRRRGAVVGMSGGIDSSVVAALCARALGPERVLGLLMPERDSSSDALRLGRVVAEQLGIAHLVEDIAGPSLRSAATSARPRRSGRSSPSTARGWRCKLVLPSLLDGRPPERCAARGRRSRRAASAAPGMPPAAYLQLVAATNFKQRTRMAMAYYHADRLNYAVAGTPNLRRVRPGLLRQAGRRRGRLQADRPPLQDPGLSRSRSTSEIPAEIRARQPTTDTYSLAQTQEEFYFALPYAEMDLCLWAVDHGVPAAEVAPAIGLTAKQVERVFRDIEAKRRVEPLPPPRACADDARP